SQVIHKTKDNNGSNIAKERGDRIGRYKFAYRNECVIARENGMKGRLRQFAKVNYHMLRVIFTNNPHKLKKLGVILSASIQGIFFRPKIEYVE
ncbi:multidrug MFS transporter, partial [Lactobacillus delbrueckii subsp. bulgaricus]|nr:multidrug MFS transporter [Lactobacillus delbrueckii subsp. bulgaricus]